ncbi:MAG: hypothetical protein GTO02_05760, partial [Candidatus Dadabacteria bacterium]|nr:hypothetical protein [Candidatus Dadabacteria bacterium]
YFNEFKYRITDGEDPNIVSIDIINRDDDVKASLWFMIKIIEGFMDDDFIARFCE